MPYIDRNEAGHIVGVYALKQQDIQEFAETAELYAPPPSPLMQIRALEAPFDDAFKKVQRQFLIASLLKDACARPEAAGLTQAQVHEALMVQGKTYAKMYTLEQSVIPFRAQL